MNKPAEKLKILHLAYTLPFPAHDGYALRVTKVMQYQQPLMDQTLLCRIINTLSPEQQALCQSSNITIKALHLPRPSRLAKLVKGVQFACSTYPVMAAGWQFRAYEKALTALLSQQTFDVIVVEGIWLAIYWKHLKTSSALKVLNLYDTESESLARQTKVQTTPWKKWLYRSSAQRMAKLEQSTISKADLVWVTSQRDKQAFRKMSPDANIEVAPNGIDCNTVSPLEPAHTREILFVGSLSYFPNKDGVFYLAHDIMPEISKLNPDIVCRIVGRNPGPEVLAAHHPPSFIVTGEVDDLESYYKRAAGCIVPLRAGGGTRLKILEAMAYGRPVISTRIGAEGLDVTHNENILIADTPPAIARETARLLNDPDLAGKLAENGRKLVEEKYDWQHIAQAMHATYLKRGQSHFNI